VKQNARTIFPSQAHSSALTWYFPLHASNMVKMKYTVGFRNIYPRLIYFPRAFTVRFLTKDTHVQFQRSSRRMCGGGHSVLKICSSGHFLSPTNYNSTSAPDSFVETELYHRATYHFSVMALSFLPLLKIEDDNKTPAVKQALRKPQRSDS